MGHADPRTTQRYYDHLEVEDLEASFAELPAPTFCTFLYEFPTRRRAGPATFGAPPAARKPCTDK